MPGPGTLDYAASVAKNTAAQTNSAEWTKLSQLMCWDAVAHCGHLAGVLDAGKYKAVLGKQNRDTHVLAKTSDPAVANAGAAKSIPAGHAIGFFTKSKDSWIMIHAMVSVGDGKAAGTKNACLGIGKPIGWEVLDLGKLSWGAGCITRGSEKVQVHHRPLTDAA